MDSQRQSAISMSSLEAPTAFVFGGVEFDLECEPGLAWALTEEHGRFIRRPDGRPAAARVHCAVRSVEMNDTLDPREIRCQWQSDMATVQTPRVSAELRELGPGRFAASARIDVARGGCTDLCTALAGAVVQRCGGLVLHATGIEFDGAGLLFVGPSGAGKTTAANLCHTGRWFARDRAAIFPTAQGWYAAGMCGGDPVHLPQSSPSTFPLRGVFRVRHAEQRVAVRPSDLMRSLMTLRENFQAFESGPAIEQERLELLLAIGADVPIYEIETVRGVALDAVLRPLVCA